MPRRASLRRGALAACWASTPATRFLRALVHASHHSILASVELISVFLSSSWRHGTCHGAALGARPPDGPSSTRTHSATSSLGRSVYRRRLRLEPLEDRRLLAVVTVTTLADTVDFNDGVTSLREAIFATNTVPGADTIDFAPALTAGGPATILLTQGELDDHRFAHDQRPGCGPAHDRRQRERSDAGRE